ncbi:hypothetical protein [Gordonia sp. (in: high G+C Gram-positive bacteria)]
MTDFLIIVGAVTTLCGLAYIGSCIGKVIGIGISELHAWWTSR